MSLQFVDSFDHYGTPDTLDKWTRFMVSSLDAGIKNVGADTGAQCLQPSTRIERANELAVAEKPAEAPDQLRCGRIVVNGTTPAPCEPSGCLTTLLEAKLSSEIYFAGYGNC
jgi:hypothetical protein